MKFPNFFLVGAPKSATTAMNHFLGQHPDIFVGPKEMHHFAPDLDSGQPADERFFVRDRDTYLSHFASATTSKCAGEASVFYLHSQEAAARIHAFNPQARIIIMLRDPVEMMYSLYGQHLKSNTEDIKDFEEALRAEPERRQGKRRTKNGWTHKCLLLRDVARYGEQVERFLHFFGPQQVMIIAYEDFKSDQARVFREVLRFLEVDDSFTPRFEVVNPARHVRNFWIHEFLRERPLSTRSPLVRVISRLLIPNTAMRRAFVTRLWTMNAPAKARETLSSALREKLQDDVAPDIAHLSRITGRDFSGLWNFTRKNWRMVGSSSMIKMSGF